MSMTVAQFVPAVFYTATGKVNSFASGSPKWLKILALANIEIDQWQDEPGVDWGSLYMPDTSIGTVTATDTFVVPSATIRKLSDQEDDVVRIIHTNGVSYTDYQTITQPRAKDFANGTRTFLNNYVGYYGNNLKFSRAFTSNDPQFGGTITVPAYGYATHLVNDTDVIPVDIPNWLVFATAASYDSTDVTRQGWVPRLEHRANQIMEVMKDNNENQNTRVSQPWRPMGENWVDQAWTL